MMKQSRDFARVFSENWNRKLKSVRLLGAVVSLCMLVCAVYAFRSTDAPGIKDGCRTCDNCTGNVSAGGLLLYAGSFTGWGNADWCCSEYGDRYASAVLTGGNHSISFCLYVWISIDDFWCE